MIPALDWINTYGPAALAVWGGESPYSVPIYFAAPWATLPLIPLVLMPYSIGRWCLLILSICAYAFTAYRLGAKPLTMALFLLSFPVLSDLANGNIEWMAMLGFVLPPQIGLIFALIKPQVGIGISIFWLVKAWREGAIREVIRIFSPLIVLCLLTFVLYGFWPMHFLDTINLANEILSNEAFDYNLSFWPFGLIIGLALIYQAITTKDKHLGIMAGPFLSPYALIATYGTSLLAWINKPLVFFVIWIITWIPVLIKLFR